MIGLFGGAFDPVHIGHLRAAVEAREALRLRELRFIPYGIPPHRAPPRAAAADRLAMLRAAIADEAPGFCVDDREIRRPGPSWTVETLLSLRAEEGLRDAPLILLLGMDVFAGIDAWHRWEELAELAHLAVIHRPGALAPTRGAAATLARERAVDDVGELAERPAGGVWFHAIPPLDISSTAIRAHVAQGGSARWLTPTPVLNYIHERGLYRAEG